MRFLELIRAAIPDADDELCDHIMWARTPFPCATVTPQKVYKAACTFDRATKNGIDLCDFCDNKVSSLQYTCDNCMRMLNITKEVVA